MHDDFGIGVGLELIAVRFERLTQLLVVLDDTVVHDGQPVAGHVRMRIVFAGDTVRGPARMRDARAAAQRSIVQRVLQFGNLAHATAAVQLATIHGRDAGGVITAVLEAPKAFYQHRYDVALRDCSDYSAHGSSPVVISSLPAVASRR